MEHPESTWLTRIGRAQQMLEERLSEEIGLDELARAAAYSPFHFHRLFRSATGETVRQYQRRLRLERAAYFLTHGQDDILKLALDAGYGSHEAFTRVSGAFRNHAVGLSCRTAANQRTQNHADDRN